MHASTPVPTHLLLKLRSCDEKPQVLVHVVLARHAALLRLPLLGRVDLSVPGLGARQLVLVSVEPAPAGQRPRVVVFDAANGPGPTAGRVLPADLTGAFWGLPAAAAEAHQHLRAVASVILAAGHERRSLN
ncbi:MAG: hypothetical protein ACRYFR_12930 [Janthinobacterium lividum]